MSNDRPTGQMIRTAAAIRREARAGKTASEIAALFYQDEAVICGVLAARTIGGASMVLYRNTLQTVKRDIDKILIRKR